MNSPALERLAPTVDELVLQVHAVDDPHRGLFDPAQADRWVHAFARRIPRPIRVALPAYDVRVTWRRDGRLASVEGERPLLTGAAPGETLRTSPQAVLALLHAMQRDAPDSLAGIVWFRLPTDSDRRAWSLDTWRAVVTDRLPAATLNATLVATDNPGLWTVTLSNDGSVDATAPRHVRLDPTCTLADGANGFRLIDWRAALPPGRGRPAARARKPGHRLGPLHRAAKATRCRFIGSPSSPWSRPPASAVRSPAGPISPGSCSTTARPLCSMRRPA